MWVCVCVGFVMSGCVYVWAFCNMYIYVYRVCNFYTVFCVLFRLCIFILICFVCTSVRIATD
jgi:hypothetical protein